MEIRPFNAYRYDSSRVGSMDRVVSAPYDQYDDESQAAAYKQSPHHYVRLIYPTDSNTHEAAANTLSQWTKEGVLKKEDVPAIYPYSQIYTDPRGGEHVRHGFFALLRLTPFEGGPVHPHERTMPKTQEDRLNLMRATKADFGPVFITFDDDDGEITRLLEEVHDQDAEISVPDGDGNEHHMWVQKDQSWMQKLVDKMKDIEGVIADGHHRYKAALQYAEEMRAMGGDDHPANFKLVAFFPAFEDNIMVSPIHRVIENWPAEADEKKFFNVSRMQFWMPEDAERAATDSGGAFGMFSKSTGTEMWAHKHGAPQIWDGEPSDDYKGVPAAALEASVLRGMLGMSTEDIGAKKGIRFVKTVAEAKRLIWGGYDRVFLLPPTPLSTIIKIAKSGEVMPQKSTYFYPKLLSGLVTYIHEA